MVSVVDEEFSPIGRSVGRAHKFLRAWGDRQLAPLDASVTDFILLWQIDAAPEPGASQTEIAHFSDMGGPALVRHLDRMERDGYVQRRRDGADRRIVRVTATDAGRDRLREIGAVMRRCDEEVRAVLTVEEQTILQTALDKVFSFAFTQFAGVEPPNLAATRSAP
jgi:DNA-binding MarR family transcriptional regulator